MSFLSGFAGGMAKGASSYMDDMQDEEDAQRKRVDANIFSTTNTMFQNAVVVRDKRQKEIKDNKAYANLLSSKDESIAKDPAKMAYVLSLPEEARQDILKLTDSDIFRTNNIPLVDYFEAIDDPIEYKDPVTLTERVRGKVIDRPLEASQYYGVSTTKDKEVDKIVAGYAGGFATAYGMSADHAQGLLDSATQEVKMQRFKINWANKKRMSAQDDAFNVAKIASSNMGMEKDSQQIAAILDTQNSNSMGKAFTSWASGEGVPPNMIETDPALPARFKASNAYGIAREEVIKQMARDMIEAPNRMLDRSTKLFFAREYPGYWGGNANETPKEDIKRAAYYEITSNGKVEVLRGIDILRKIKAAANKNGTKPETSITETEEILGEEGTLLVTEAQEAKSAAIIKDESLRQDSQTNITAPTIDTLKQKLIDAPTSRERQILQEQIIQAEESQGKKDKLAKEEAEYDRYGPDLGTAKLMELAAAGIMDGRKTPSPNLVYRRIKELYPNMSEIVARRFADEAAEAYNAAN